MRTNTSNSTLSIKNRLTLSGLKYVGLTRLAVGILCVPFFSLGQQSLKAQDSDMPSASRSDLDQDSHFVKASQQLMRGHDHLEQNHFPEAIDEYTAVLELPETPNGIKASALMNRGVAKSSLGRDQEAINDFEAALAIPVVKEDLKASLFLNRGQAHDRLGHTQEALNNYTASLETPGIHERTKALVLRHQQVIQDRLGRSEEGKEFSKSHSQGDIR